MTQHRHQDAPTSVEALPTPVSTYLTAHAAGEADAALTSFTADAVVTDECRDYVGLDAIEAWMAGSSSEYTYSTEFISATTTDAGTVDVVQHLEGDFPGGVADLHFRFTLAGALISRLVIEP